MAISNSTKHFVDTNVLLRHANDDSHTDCRDIGTIIVEAIDGKRKLWASTIVLAELRASNFVPGKFETVDELCRYLRSIIDFVSPPPSALLQCARLRDLKWVRPPDKRGAEEKPCCMTLGDAIHLTSALWVKQALDLQDLEFLTLDNGRKKSIETDPGTKSLPILSLEQFTYGISSIEDVRAVVELQRVKPILNNPRLIN